MSKRKPNQKTNSSNKGIKKRFKYKFVKNSKKAQIKAKTIKNMTKNSDNLDKHTENKNISTKDTSKNNKGKTSTILSKQLEIEYMEKLLDIHYDNYADAYLYKALEKLNQNKIIITKDILKKFGLTEEIRKYVLNYFQLFIESHQINSNLYFLTVSFFDSFLINYSNLNNNAKCMNLFISKNERKFSYTKLILLIFCCYYITAKFYKTKLLTIDDLLKYDHAKEEFTYDELYNLIKDIIQYNDSDIDILNIYSFIDIFLFKIKRIFKICNWDNSNNFLGILEKSISYFGAKIGKKIFLQNIEDSFQALGIIIFCYKMSKLRYDINENIDLYIRTFLVNVKDFLIKYYGTNKLPIIINWLNDNWNE